MPDEPAPSQRPGLSIVVPAYNEEKRLGPSLRRLIEYAAAQPFAVEIVVVDDGGADGTAAAAEEALRELPPSVTARILKHETNRGKGAAVRTGALAAAGDYVLTCDADLASPPKEYGKLLAALDAGADVAAGSRVQPDGSDMRASQPLFRRMGGRLFAAVRRRLLLSDVQDTQCGFKAFRRAAAQALFPRQRLDGWAFDAELLFLASKLGFSVAQVPIEWQHMEDSRFHLGLFAAFRELRDLASIRWRHRGVRPQPTAS
jgi:dolichyl-phosphate beta-glucosyltransferase